MGSVQDSADAWDMSGETGEGRDFYSPYAL